MEFNYFCPKCGNLVCIEIPFENIFEDRPQEEPKCAICGETLKPLRPYSVPVIDTEGEIQPAKPEDVRELKRTLNVTTLPDKQDAINVLVDGELNGIDTGKKIREKNEQLKKKVAGYENEQRALRTEIERQIEQKHKEQGV